MTSYPRHRIASLTTASGYQRPTDKLFFQKRKELGTFLLPELANHSLREMPRQRECREEDQCHYAPGADWLWEPAPIICKSQRGSLRAPALMQQHRGPSASALLPYRGRADVALWLRPRSSLLHPIHQPPKLLSTSKL